MHRTVFAGLGFALCLATPATAALYATGFEAAEGYSVGPIDNQQGWLAPDNPEWVVTDSAPLTGGQSLTLSAYDPDLLSFAFAEQTGDIWVGFKTSYVNFNSTDFITIVLDGATVDGTNAAGIAFRQTSIYARIVNPGSQYGTDVGYDGSEAYVVFRVSKDGVNGSAGNYDLVEAYLNPGLTLPAAPDASQDFDTGASSLQNIVINSGGNSTNYDAGDVFKLDDLVLGTAFSDVAIPEPASVALLGLAGLTIAGRRRAH